MYDDEEPRHVPANRRTAPSKLRRGGRHCPVCIAPLQKNAKRTRLRRECIACGAHPIREKRCARCGAANIWEGRSGAGCVTCGHHGRKEDVLG